MSEHLTGQTAIVVGGKNPSGVAKIIGDFFKKKEKVEMKAGIVNERALTKEEIKVLAKLPGLEVLRAQLLGLLTHPTDFPCHQLATALSMFAGKPAIKTP